MQYKSEIKCIHIKYQYKTDNCYKYYIKQKVNNMLHIKINEVDSGLDPLFFTMFLIILSICTKAAKKIIIIYTNNSWRDRTYIP